MKRIVTVSLFTLLCLIMPTMAAHAQFQPEGFANGRDIFAATGMNEGDTYTVSATLNGAPFSVFYGDPYGGPVTQISAINVSETETPEIKLYLFVIPPPSGMLQFTATPVGGGTALTGSKDYGSAPLTPTTTSLSTTPLSQTYGAVNLTANVTPIPDGGTVTFWEGALNLGTRTPNGSGVASLYAEGFQVGTHTITAVYGGDANFETSTASAITLTVNPANLTVIGITADPKIYDGGPTATLHTAGASLQGKVSTDAITADYAGATGTFSNKDIGVGKTVSITIAISGTSLGNYNYTPPTTTADISPKVLTVTGITAVDRAYDGTTNADLDTHAVALSGVVGSEHVNVHAGPAIGSFADKNVGGSKPVTVSGIFINGPDGGNYTVAQPTTLTASISKATASVIPLAGTKTYGAPDPALSGSINGFVGNDHVTAHYTRVSGETVAGGPYTISATLSPTAALDNYDINYGTAPFTITKATASVTPNLATKVYGATDPALTGTLSGFLPADNVTATYARTPGETVAGSPYTISATLSGGTAVLYNYDIAYNTALFTVTKATASVTPNAATKVYGAPEPTLTGTLTGFLPADGVTATYSRTAGETVAGSPYLISATLSPAGVLGNYSIGYSTAQFTITANASATVLTSSAATSVYGQSVTFTATVTGVLSTPTGTVTFKDATTILGTGTLNSSGVATLSTSALTVGTHSITAEYGGDANFASSISSPVSQIISAPLYTLTVSSIHGSVAKAPDQSNYVSGTPVTLTATSEVGYHFTGWSGDATGSVNPVTVTMDGNRSVTANFAINTYTLTLTASNGTITKTPDHPTYSAGATVQLSAIPAPTYHFANWSGDVSGTSNPITVTIDANKNITANFVGNTAPTVGTITAPLDPVAINSVVNASVTFTDPDPNDPHTATWNWGDGASSAGVISAQNVVTGSHSYTAAGVYTVGVTVSDAVGAQATIEYEFVVVYNPNGGFVVGGAWITSPAGAYVKNPTYVGKGYFAFVATYLGNSPVPQGITSFQLKPSLFKPAVMDFKSTNYQWLVVSGALAQYKGVGTINGSGSYGFLLAVTDGNVTGGDKKDRFRIKIWDKNNGDAIVYDNQAGADDDTAPTTVIDGGLIVVYSSGSGNRYMTDTAPSIESVIDQDAETMIPTEYTLYNAYPNPFNPSTTIRFDLPEATKVRLAVYDMLGREVAVLADGERPAGQYALRFDAGKLSSGTYIYRLQTGNYVQTRKLMLMK